MSDQQGPVADPARPLVGMDHQCPRCGSHRVHGAKFTVGERDPWVFKIERDVEEIRELLGLERPGPGKLGFWRDVQRRSRHHRDGATSAAPTTLDSPNGGE